MNVATTIALRSITAAGWTLALLAILPIGDFVSDDARNLALSVAIVGSLAWIVDWHHGSTRSLVQQYQGPAVEVFEAGKAIGRQQLLLEQAAGEQVVSLVDRRHLRAATDDERAIGGGHLLV